MIRVDTAPVKAFSYRPKEASAGVAAVSRDLCQELPLGLRSLLLGGWVWGGG